MGASDALSIVVSFIRVLFHVCFEPCLSEWDIQMAHIRT